MNPGLIFHALRARFRLFALVVGVTVAATAAVSLLLPKSYRTTASLVLDTREEQSLSNGLNVLVAPRERTGYIQTQVDILTSPKVARKVVDDLGLAERASLRQDFEEATDGAGSIEQWLANDLLRDVEVETSQSSVVHVSYPAHNPHDAALIANGFARAYMDTMLELRVEPTRQAASWFDEQLQTLRADLEAAQARMTAFQQEHGIVWADASLDDEHVRLAELSEQLLRVQERTVELRSQERQGRMALAQGAPLDRLPEVQSNAYVQELNSTLQAGEARLQVLATQYGANYPEYRRQRAENRSRREALEAEVEKILAATHNRRLQSEQREAELEAALARQRTRLLELKESRDALSVLTRNVDTAQSAYDTAMQRFVVSQVESRASRTNVAMLNLAEPPREPYRPKFELNLALSLFVGSTLGAVLVMLLEVTDRRVRSVLDLGRDAGVPLLGELNAWAPSGRLLLAGPAGASPHDTDRHS